MVNKMICLKKRKRTDRFINMLFSLVSSLSIFVTLGIFFILIKESFPFFQQVSIKEFLGSSEWAPLFYPAKYGIWPLLSGTLVTSMVALLFAIPVGTILSVYLSEYTSEKVRELLKPLLEILGAVPSVVYGYFALVVVTPWLQQFLPDLPGFNMLSAGLVIGLMIIPYISSLSEDAMRGVPMSLREASAALGATKLQTSFRVVVPAAFSGMMASYILGVSRAIGETMVVAIAAGMQANLTWNPTEPAGTMTAYIVQVGLGDVAHGSMAYQSIFAVGLILMMMTLLLNMLGFFLRYKFRRSGV
jgi:phosphate transport system permease protein